MGKTLLRSKKGFTLIEAVITIGMLGVVITVLGNYILNGAYAWNMGAAKMQIAGEGRIAIEALAKFIQNAQAATITISRFNDSQPADSYISGKLAETIYLNVNTGACGFASGGSNMVGTAGGDFAIYQNGRYLVLSVPKLASGTNFSDPTNAVVTYNNVTLTANLESLMLTFEDSKLGKSISTGVKLSKRVYPTRPEVRMLLKKPVVIKHYHTSGYYGN
jgi:type II secretory pathway pseudopilin PulG